MMGVIWIVDTLFMVLEILILVRVLLSFINHNPYQPVIRFIYEMTEPLLKPFRKINIPINPGMSIDLSPVIALFALWIIRSILMRLLSVLLLP